MNALRLVPLALLAACASSGLPLDAPRGQVQSCTQWYEALDRAVDQAGVRDAQYARIEGFAHFRVDRTLASLRGQAARDARAMQAFAERLGELDLEARRYEILNLPEGSFGDLPGLGAGSARDRALRRTADCGRLLRELDLAKPESRAALLERARVPDDYSLAARTLGLYPVTRLAFFAGVRGWERRTLEAFGRWRPAEAAVRYAPPFVKPLSRPVIGGLLARARFDPLGMPTLSERELAGLAAVYAPSFEIRITGDHDRFGEMRWRRDGETPEINASELAVYVNAAHTRYREHLLLQLVYTIWFPERPRRGALDFLAGRLDGLVWRVTLAPDGEPLLYDSIHPCGCYHKFFPTPRARPLQPPRTLEEWAFVPQRLPRVAEGERPVVRLASGTHAIEQVTLVRGSDSLARYGLRAYDELRSLQRRDGERRSAFGPDGLIAGSERAERFFFWPTGVASAGAMRQWGRHATAFVGRRHFDDPDLIERRFDLDLGEAP
jgi:hypothetical protein